VENIENKSKKRKSKNDKLKNYLAILLAALMILGFVLPVALQILM